MAKARRSSGITPKNFKPGMKKIPAKMLNSLVDLARPLIGVDRPRQPRPFGKASGGSAISVMTLVSVGDDYLVCDLNGSNVNVAKPWLLRKWPFDGQTHNGITYTYTSNVEREATDGTNTETQFVTPDYVVGDEIYAAFIESGITTSTDEGSPDPALQYQEINQGRAWATELETQ